LTKEQFLKYKQRTYGRQPYQTPFEEPMTTAAEFPADGIV
jgi:hypothetical protein